jgi:hypothetical protein
MLILNTQIKEPGTATKPVELRRAVPAYFPRFTTPAGVRHDPGTSTMAVATSAARMEARRVIVGAHDKLEKLRDHLGVPATAVGCTPVKVDPAKETQQLKAVCDVRWPPGTRSGAGKPRLRFIVSACDDEMKGFSGRIRENSA